MKTNIEEGNGQRSWKSKSWGIAETFLKNGGIAGAVSENHYIDLDLNQGKNLKQLLCLNS